MATEDEIRRLILEVVGEKDVNKLKESVDELSSSLASSGGGKKSGGHNLQQNLTAASYALQDFTSAGGDLGQKLNSITNNIPGILAGLGGLATAVSVAVVAAVALYKNWDAISSLWETKLHLPKDTGEAVADLTKEIHENKEAMEKLEKQTSLTFEEMEKYSLLVTKTAIAEANLAQAKKERMALEKVGREKPEAAARGAAFAEGAKGFQDEITKALMEQGWDVAGAQGIISGAAMGDEQLLGVAMEAMAKSTTFPRKQLSHIRAGMPDTKEQFRLADETTKEIEKDNEQREKIRIETLQSFEDEERELKTQQQEDKQERTKQEQAKKHAHAEKLKAEHHTASVESQRAKHEAELLGDAFADRAQFMAKGFIGRGYSPEQVQAKMVQDFRQAGATRGGAEEAAKRQMEKVMTDIVKNGGLAASLVLQQGKLQRTMLEHQRQIESVLMEARGDLNRNWDTATRKGK